MFNSYNITMKVRIIFPFALLLFLLWIFNSCDTHDEDSIDPGSLNQWKSYNTSNGLTDNRISAIFKDEQGIIWIGTDGGGVNYYDGKSWSVLSTYDGLLSNNIYSIGQDKDGNIWFGTSAGVNILVDDELFYFFDLEGIPVYSFLNARNDIFWIGTAGMGVILYNYTSFHPITFENPDLNTINVIIQDESGTLWLGTNGGAIKTKGTSFDVYDETTGLCSNRVSDIMEDSWGDIWFSSIYGKYLTRYDGQKSEYVGLFGFNDGLVTAMVEDWNHDIWCATGFGIMKYNGVEMEFVELPESFTDDLFLYVDLDSEGNLWIGTASNGIYHYSTE